MASYRLHLRRTGLRQSEQTQGTQATTHSGFGTEFCLHRNDLSELLTRRWHKHDSQLMKTKPSDVFMAVGMAWCSTHHVKGGAVLKLYTYSLIVCLETESQIPQAGLKLKFLFFLPPTSKSWDYRTHNHPNLQFWLKMRQRWVMNT